MSFGPHISASQVKKSDSEMGPVEEEVVARVGLECGIETYLR